MTDGALSPSELQQARFRAHLTQEEAASAIGVAPTTISRWERGAATPAGGSFARMLEVYGLRRDFGLEETVAAELRRRVADLERQVAALVEAQATASPEKSRFEEGTK